ncbi:MAG TPA: HAD-IIB family hydrolase [Pirellulaceae bacterium]|nr:HAD-IIB family hydrolase [Pirellulaceae bacterium]HMO91309.1 HAD-IIB family hydrolase [Pirellulaceae bacterium]HMP68507.1 HAD-IIB family hydrolase [Pirellulaceae bacterium]
MRRKLLIVSDVDGTLLGDAAALQQLGCWLAQPRDAEVVWVYSSGRFFESVRRTVIEHHLPEPRAIIGGVGSEIVNYANGQPIAGWSEQLDSRFAAAKIQQALRQFARLELQPAEFQSRFKVSYYFHNAKAEELRQLESALSRAEINCQLIYSSQRDLDILPAQANKGNSAKFIAALWKYPQENVIVAGDSQNDLSMFRTHFRGIVVGNAVAELRSISSQNVFQADKQFAAGVLQGLQHWLQQSPKTDRLQPRS